MTSAKGTGCLVDFSITWPETMVVCCAHNVGHKSIKTTKGVVCIRVNRNVIGLFYHFQVLPKIQRLYVYAG